MTKVTNSQGALLLIFGDLITFIFSLILTLTLRYGEVPSSDLLGQHLPSFILLSAIFIVVHLSAGLYDKQASIIRGRTQRLLLRTQVMNALIGIIFFYFAPLAIAPKTNLFIYFVVSTILLYIWRTIMFPVFSSAKKQPAILVGAGSDLSDLYEEINGNERYGLVFSKHLKPGPSPEETATLLKQAADESGASMVVADLHDPKVESVIPILYKLIFSGIQVIDASRLYESVFDRIPVSMLGERWLIENSSTALGNRRTYDTIKRLMDVVLAFVGGTISLVFYPFVYAAIKLDDKGPLFITQERVGRNGKNVQIVKFRSMSGDDKGRYGEERTTKHVVTRVGNFLRRSRIDELPQFWNVVKGDLSLVGPRPELPALVSIYDKEIPYYNARHLVKPGLFGWAQIYHEAHPHHEVATQETRNKLSYDLFYIKNRSLLLDLRIMIRTMQIILSRSGR